MTYLITICLCDTGEQLARPVQRIIAKALASWDFWRSPFLADRSIG